MCAKNDEKIQLLYNFFGRTVEKILGFLRFSKKIQNKLRISRNTMKIFRSSICMFIEVSTEKQFKIQFLG